MEVAALKAISNTLFQMTEILFKVCEISAIFSGHLSGILHECLEVMWKEKT